MFGIGSTELLVILLVALIVLGPRSLAGFSSKLGRLIGEFRRVSTDFQRTLNLEAAQAEAREAERKKAQTSSVTREADTEPESKPVSAKETPSAEDLRLHGIPDDSPLAQALNRARKQAESGGCKPAARKEAPMAAEVKADGEDAVRQEENDNRA